MAEELGQEDGLWTALRVYELLWVSGHLELSMAATAALKTRVSVSLVGAQPCLAGSLVPSAKSRLAFGDSRIVNDY